MSTGNKSTYLRPNRSEGAAQVTAQKMRSYWLVPLWLLRYLIVGGHCSVCNWRESFSVKLSLSQKQVSGTVLQFAADEPRLLQHPCTDKNLWGGPAPALYLGGRVFFSKDGFESSLLPLSIPSDLVSPTALVSAATFVKQNQIAMVINGRVYLYIFADEEKWQPAEGIHSPVADLSNTYCCFSWQDLYCDNVSMTLFAYETGHSVSESQIFLSENGGFTFRLMKVKSALQHVLLGVYNFISLSVTGLLINSTQEDEGKGPGAYFIYINWKRSHEVYRRSTVFQLMSKEGASIQNIQHPSLSGYIILWTKGTLMLSFNNGLITEAVTILPTDEFPGTSLPTTSLFHVAISTSEIAVFTQENQLFYGILGMFSTSMVLTETINTTDAGCCVLQFERTGILTLLRPIRNNDSHIYNFQKCTYNMQSLLMDKLQPMQYCTLEVLNSPFHNKIFYIDMYHMLNFTATFVPKRGTGAFPLVTVSNPHVLSFQAHVVQDGYTDDGNTKYRLSILLMQQCFSDMAEPHFWADLHEGGVSILNVDAPKKGVFCVDILPLSAFINVGCPPTKQIRLFKNATACSKELFHQDLLRNNFTYIISYDIYDPEFLARQNLEQSDLQIHYDYETLGCPLLVYHDDPWSPVLELWENSEFVEYVSVDFVMFEVNGIHNYDYLLTAAEADCISQPQNWTSLLKEQDSPDPNTAWNRKNYINCENPNGPKLVSPSAKYQVLGGRTKNKIIFSQYNGLYVFKAIVVDKFYSYCELSTFFCVYVYGALPKSYINPWVALTVFFTIIFVSILMGYILPTLSLIKIPSKVKIF
ncbi:PREDICTED: cation channel sperm-associated protein subunit delta [Crocodylus porosus]|uniref:cation channel sperm-associated protein subunit delta n=1 Tax=Crocodylus porosus TaxID=8502 RepID=UPI00093BB2F0|nr:PREDICTED: cation channel sperm-associated protein subunit delta [Crocodylus porosus]